MVRAVEEVLSDELCLCLVTWSSHLQPLTSLTGPKCKRCGFYEEDKWKNDDVFHEWELCPSLFSPAPDNRQAIFHTHELNVSLICLGCRPEVPGESRRGVPALLLFVLKFLDMLESPALRWKSCT